MSVSMYAPATKWHGYYTDRLLTGFNMAAMSTDDSTFAGPIERVSTAV